jgi:nitric oxide reductase subunit C
MKIKPIHIFIGLSLCFLTYSFSIYIHPIYAKTDANINIEKAVNGRLVWQKYNCQSCHQLYGLGGYLGTDLTNIYSAKGKGEVVIKAVISTGNDAMPAYQLSENEFTDLMEFFKQTNQSGRADYNNFTIYNNGMIERK